ncbi:MAG: RNA-binding domain-containing protein [Candidatus Bathyarchaeia archaeon]
MPRSPIAYIDMSFFVHATEDPEKVIKAAQNVVSAVSAEKISFKKSKLKGEYGNPIIYFRTRIREETVVNSILKQISSKLPSPDKERLLRELSLRLEKGSLYIRFDKQAAFKGNLRFCVEDPIHMRIKFRRSKTNEVIKACREIGLLPESHI